MTREQRMQKVAAVVEQVIIRGGPELNPLMIATAAVMAWEKSNEYRDTDATTEIEITPAMKEAGALALSEYNKFVETSEDGAIAVFIAMTKAALHPIE